MNAFVRCRNQKSWAAFVHVGLGVCAVGLLGCGSTTVQMPATELAKLSTPAFEQSEDWPTVRTVDGGETQIVGEIETISVETPMGPQQVSRPFAARINGPFLEINDLGGLHGIPLQINPKATVQYTSARTSRYITGGLLTGFGVPVLGLGILGIVAGVDLASSSGPSDLGIGLLLGGSLVVLGAAGAAGGLAMGIPGVYMLATNPSKPKNQIALQNPQLRVGPQGASFSAAF